MSFLDWYLNLTFLQAVLVWLKLLLPVVFILTVCALVGFSLKLFSGSLKVPKLPNNIQPKRGKQPSEKQTA